MQIVIYETCKSRFTLVWVKFLTSPAKQGYLLAVYSAHMTSNQSEGEEEDRLLFGEQLILLFSKSKMAEVFFNQSGAIYYCYYYNHSSNQSGAELRMQDSGLGSATLSSRKTWNLGSRFP